MNKSARSKRTQGFFASCSRLGYRRSRFHRRLKKIGYSTGPGPPRSGSSFSYFVLRYPVRITGVFTVKQFDQRSLAAKRRNQATCKANDVMLDMLKTAIKAGHSAKYVLFDSWFSNPRDIIRIHSECGMNTIAMIKKSSKVFYDFKGKNMDVKQIFGMCKKRRGRSKYLLSVNVNIALKSGKSLPAKIVYVRNQNKKKEWIASICTDTNLPEEEILRIYGKRWDIEVFFKTCKSLLKLGPECHSLSYDALTAHVSLVFIRYMLLSLQQRNNTDDRTISELFLLMIDEMADIT